MRRQGRVRWDVTLVFMKFLLCSSSGFGAKTHGSVEASFTKDDVS